MDSRRETTWRDRRVLVTGHTGFKGAWLWTWLEHLGARVEGLALPPATSPSLHDLLGRATPPGDQVDVRDAAAVLAGLEGSRPEVVFHLAAQSLVRRSFDDPVGTFATNVMRHRQRPRRGPGCRRRARRRGRHERQGVRARARTGLHTTSRLLSEGSIRTARRRQPPSMSPLRSGAASASVTPVSAWSPRVRGTSSAGATGRRIGSSPTSCAPGRRVRTSGSAIPRRFVRGSTCSTRSRATCSMRRRCWPIPAGSRRR